MRKLNPDTEMATHEIVHISDEKAWLHIFYFNLNLIQTFHFYKERKPLEREAPAAA